MNDKSLNILPIIKKEFRQIRRDKRALGILIFIPAFLLVLVGYALNFDVKHLSVAILDQDNSSLSRDFVSSFTQSEYLNQGPRLSSIREIDRVLEDESAHLVVVIPKSFSKELSLGREVPVQIIIDGSNSNTASIAAGYISLAVEEFSRKLLFEWYERKGVEVVTPIDLRPQLWYNPDLKTERFLIPGLFGLILMIMTVVSTSLSIVKEKESGTLEQLMTSPLRARELFLGKMIPYLAIGLIASSIILIASTLLFEVNVQGNLLLLYGSIILFLLAGLGQGLLVSTIAQTQQVAFLVSILSSLLPAFLLSGFIFPIDSMPIALQVLSNLMPTKFFLIIVRSIMIKGVGFLAVWEQFLYLSLFILIVLSMSMAKLRREMAQ